MNAYLKREWARIDKDKYKEFGMRILKFLFVLLIPFSIISPFTFFIYDSNSINEPWGTFAAFLGLGLPAVVLLAVIAGVITHLMKKNEYDTIIVLFPLGYWLLYYLSLSLAG